MCLTVYVVYCYAEGYDKMQSELVKAKESLTKIFTSKDVNKTVCTLLYIFKRNTLMKNLLYVIVLTTQLLDMVELNELNMSLVTLLDENIASANRSDQVSNCNRVFSMLISIC